MLKAGFIAIVGRPNSGKSTLLNAVMDSEISIVTPKAQTTRDQVVGILSQADVGQIVFIDTPGIHKAREGGLNQYMVNQAIAALESPHVIWYLVDPSSALEHEQPVIDLIARAVSGHSIPVFLLMNKIDFAESKKIPASRLEGTEKDITQALKDKNVDVRAAFKISGLTKAGLPDLLAQSWALMPESPPYYPDQEQLSDRPTRFFVSEKIREQLYRNLGEEIPYSCAVEINKFDENPKLPRIEATIHVERESQKGMVIGGKGSKIKEIGQAARVEIEKFLGQKIFLGLKVDLLKNWSQNADALRKMGYDLPATGKKGKGKRK